MQVIDPGHLYRLDVLDWGVREEVGDPSQTIRFVKRIGDKFPGNTGAGYPGTLSQEVIRVLIDRAHYVDDQRPHPRNALAIGHLRQALRELELRAAEERGDIRAVFQIASAETPELLSTCDGCGHIACDRSHT